MDKSGCRILFMSNGHGEDLIAAQIIKHLAKEDGMSIRALPIVGTGAAYTAIDIPLILPGWNLPSGGFVRNGFGNLLMDLRAGLFSLTRRQIQALRRVRPEIDLAVCVGDSYLTILAGYFLRRPIIFLPTAKSDYVSPHWPVERWWMRRFCSKIITRDELTAQSLASYGLPAEFFGNVMMDCLDYRGDDLKGPEDQWTIGILPGSRLEAYENMEDIAEVVLAVPQLIADEKLCRPVRFLVALAGTIGIGEIAARLKPKRWVFQEPDANEARRGLVGYLDYDGQNSRVRLTFAQGRFADILTASNLILGLAGTGNEQAVGLGKPVVAFVGRGTQFTAKFVKTQQKLLGESVRVVPREPETVAREILHILTDQALRERMAVVGRERMGEPGGAQRIARAIAKLAGLVQRPQPTE
jgi:uncharacterized protein (TIGR03492 family)